MERRGFLKGLFGAAVVAAMPKVVVDQIENLPPEPVKEKKFYVEGVQEPPIHSVPIFNDNGLYIYDENQLIGYSHHFSLDLERKINRIKDDSFWPEYSLGLPSWSVSANHIHWNIDVRKVFEDNKLLNFLITQKDIRINGQGFISQISSFNPLDEPLRYSAYFEGTGALMIN